MEATQVVYGSPLVEPTITLTGWIILAVIALVTIACYALFFKNKRKGFRTYNRILWIAWLAYMFIAILPIPAFIREAIPVKMYSIIGVVGVFVCLFFGVLLRPSKIHGAVKIWKQTEQKD